jgi:hypothetical protein
MKLGSRRALPAIVTLTSVWLLQLAVARGQTAVEQKPLLAEQVFKDVQVLKGTSVPEFMATMGFFSASLGADCSYCHVPESSGNWERYADDNPHKRSARRMVQMMSALNQTYFGGRRLVTCYSCHRGFERPKVTPSLAALYGPPPPDEGDDAIAAAPNAPAADQVLDRFFRALGGRQQLAALTSFVATGTYQGFGDADKQPLEIVAKADGQRTTIVHTANGDSITTFDGHAGWTAAPPTDAPVPVLALTGGELDAARLDADLGFPLRITQALTGWRVGFPSTIDDRDVTVVQGTSARRSPVKFYFDQKSDLLVRLVRYTDSPVGLIPTQIDYADYRDVSGIKMPYRWTVTWLDGRSIIELAEVHPNVPVDAAKFARPAKP